jgi:hypothetical protein
MSGAGQSSEGGLVGWIGNGGGSIVKSWASGKVSMSASAVAGVGGLAGGSYGGTASITDSYSISTVDSTGSISSGSVDTGGLVGNATAMSVGSSFATGSVSSARGSAGGLIGSFNQGSSLTNSYATGNISAAANSAVGGLIGNSDATVASSYSTGQPAAPSAGIGGLIGYDASTSGNLAQTYWDTTTSGVANPAEGAGNIANDPGITAQTTTQFQAGLPKGFSNIIWGEKSTINGGLPYLLANTPH